MKIKILIITMLMVLVLSACSGSQAGDQSSIPNQEQSNDIGETITDNNQNQTENDQSQTQAQETVQLSPQMRLIVGTMSLEKAGLNLSAEQANSLLPLWKVMKNLLGSETSAQAEIDALFTQIQSEFSAEQLSYLENFTMSQEEYQAIIAEYVPEDLLNSGILMTEEEREERRATAMAENGGTVPQELLGSGGGKGMGGGSGVPRSITGGTPSAGTGVGQGVGGGTGQINIYLIEGLIIELETIAAP